MRQAASTPLEVTDDGASSNRRKRENHGDSSSVFSLLPEDFRWQALEDSNNCNTGTSSSKNILLFSSQQQRPATDGTQQLEHPPQSLQGDHRGSGGGRQQQRLKSMRDSILESLSPTPRIRNGSNRHRRNPSQNGDGVMIVKSSNNNNNNNNSPDDCDGGAYYDNMAATDAAAEAEEEEEIYVVRQKYGYCSIFFSIVQTIILAVMMWQCGIAPLNINPMLGPYPDALSEWGGKNSVLILEDGQWWRLITPILLHAGIIHLVCNIAVQVDIGVFFEQEWGSARWLIVYLTSAVGSSALSVIAMPDAVSVGSSGAVMGLFGGKLAEVILRAFERTRTKEEAVGKKVRNEQCMAVTCSVIVVMAFSFIPYVDWAAHLGGLVAGFVVGIMVFAVDLQLMGCKLFWLIAGSIITIVTFVLLFTHMYSGDIEAADELRDVCGYYQQYFDDYECKCMKDEYLNNGGGNGGGGSGD